VLVMLDGRDEVVLTAPDGARVLLLGGEPFAEPLLMWWNFVARTRAEIDEARRQWAAADDRFGRVASRLARVPSPPAPWTRAS
jgi:redox-sensitive bicupin YhaK (pirin superfamily)